MGMQRVSDLTKALHLVHWPTFLVLKFLILSEQGVSFIYAYTDLVYKAINHF